MLFNTCKKYADRNQGFMYWPQDFTKKKWNPGEISMEGGESYLMPFKPKSKPDEEKKVQSEELK